MRLIAVFLGWMLVGSGWLRLEAQTPRITSPQFELLAREAAKVEAQRYAVWRANLDRNELGDAARAELERLAQLRKDIDVRFRAEPALRNEGYAWNSRIREIVAADIGPSWNQLMLERFPLPARIRADFPDDLRYNAALVVLGYEFTLGRTVRPPRTPALDARDKIYSDAQERIAAQLKGPQPNLRQQRAYENGFQALTHSAAFKREVLGRYIPLFASFVREEKTTRTETPAPSGLRSWLFRPVWELDDNPDNDVPLGVVLLVVPALMILLVTPLLANIWVWRRGRNDFPAGGVNDSSTIASPLPPDLRVLELPRGMRPTLRLTTGLVVDRAAWTEHHRSTHTTQGGPYQPAQVHVSTSTVLKERLWVRTLDGKEQPWTVTKGVFVARAGHWISWVEAPLRRGDSRLILMYNHASDSVFERPWVKQSHNSSLFISLLLGLFWVTPWVLAGAWLGNVMLSDWLYLNLIGSMLVGLLVVVFVLNWRAVRMRRNVWERLYRPRLLEFLRQHGQALPVGLTPAGPRET